MKKKLLLISILGSVLLYIEIIFQIIQVILKDTYVSAGYLSTFVIIIAFIINWMNNGENKIKTLISIILYNFLMIIDIFYIISLLTGYKRLIYSNMSTIYVFSELFILIPIVVFQIILIINNDKKYFKHH